MLPAQTGLYRYGEWMEQEINEGFYEESKELHCLTRCVALKFKNLLTSSRYFSELKDLSLDGLAM